MGLKSDIVGNVAIVKFPAETKLPEKKKIADKIMKENRSVKTVLEKTGKFKGRLRKQETKFIKGERTKEAVYRENGCVFRFNVDKTYFSPRLAGERKEIAESVKKKDDVLVMFSGVAPFPVVIAKKSGKKIFSNEINREANKYAELNVELNKLKDRIELIKGDVKKMAAKMKDRKFDVIVMPRPRLKETFLKEAFSLSRKGTRIFYYDFCREEEISGIVEKIKEESKKSGRKIKILKIKKAGEIAPHNFRIRIDFRIL